MTTPNRETAGGAAPGGCPPPEILALLMDGALDDGERARLEEHLASCPDCLEVLAVSAKAIESGPRSELLVPLPNAAPPPFRPPSPLRIVRRWAWASAAAGLVLLGAAAWLAPAGRGLGPRPDDARIVKTGAPAPAGAAGEPRGVELAGGFLAASGAGDTTTLCVQSDGDTVRWALVRGSVFVELGPDAPPVRLVTPHAMVTVDPGEAQLDVSGAGTDVFVGSGKATVEGNGGRTPLRLTAGQAAAARPAKDPERVARAGGLRVPDWVQTARARHLEEIAGAAFRTGP